MFLPQGIPQAKTSNTAFKSILPKLSSHSNDDKNSVDSLTSLDSLLCYARDNCLDSTFKGMSLDEIRDKPATLCPNATTSNGRIYYYRVDLLGPEGDDNVYAMVDSENNLQPIVGGTDDKLVRQAFNNINAAGPNATVPCGNFRLRAHDVSISFVSGIVPGMEQRLASMYH